MISTNARTQILVWPEKDPTFTNKLEMLLMIIILSSIVFTPKSRYPQVVLAAITSLVRPTNTIFGQDNRYEQEKPKKLRFRLN